MKLIDKCLGILYPQTCYFCGKVCKTHICKECEGKVTYIHEPICKKCGKPLRYEEKEYCTDCAEKDFYYEQGRSVWLHAGNVPWSIYQFKYHNRRIYGEFYAEELFRLYGDLMRKWMIDTIIPIPLHRRRRRTRGYNQAELVARHLGKLANLQVDTKSVIRVNYTRPQKELSQKERQKNLRNAFRVTKHWKPGKNILLIDDIYTTGSTINSVAEVLKEKGAQKVWFLTISIGQGF